MKKFFPFFFTVILLPFIIHAQSNHVVISQIFGGGGNANAPFKYDFVELFNPTTLTVNLAGWSVQYSSATGATWSNTNKIDLTGSIAPGKYFLIQCKGGGSGSPLPTPDLIAAVNVNISATDGKVALVKSTAVLSGNCPDFSSMVDFVGFGTVDCR